MTTLDKEKLFLGEQITEKDQTLSSSQKDDISQSNKEFFEKYPSDFVKSLVENKLSQSTSSKKGSFTIKPSFVLKIGAIAAILVMAFVLPLSIVNSSAYVPAVK